MFRKSLSFLLVVILVMSALTVLPVTINAKEFEIVEDGLNIELAEIGVSKTADEAAQWAVSKNGQALDYDGHYGAQCVDFIYYYYAYLGVAVAGGHAYYYMSNSLPSGWYRTSSPSKGDIIVWDKDYSDPDNYGHIGIVVNVSGGYIDYMDQNSWEYGQKVGRHNGYLASKAGTYIHPDFASPEPTLDFTPVDVGTDFYANIYNSKTSKNVVVLGSNVQIDSGNGDDWQKWYFERKDTMAYKITNVATGKVLDVANFGTENRTNIQVCPSADNYAQRWYIKAVGNGYSLVPMCALNSCMDIANSGNIQLFEQTSNSDQIFTFPPQPAFVAQCMGNDFIAAIRFSATGSVVTAYDNFNVGVSSYTGDEHQLWRFERKNNRSYKITNIATGRCLDDANWGTNDKTNIQICPSNDSTAQRWFFKAVSNGFSLAPQCAVNSCIDSYDGGTQDGMNVYLWRQNATDAQIILLDYVLTPKITDTFNGNRYELYDVPLPWNEAKRFCEQQGGHLVTITSQDEQNWVTDFVNENATHNYVWLGATDNYTEGIWKWVSEESFSYTNWDIDEPNDKNNEDYLMMYNNTGKWNDALNIYRYINDDYCFVCEYDNAVPISTEPITEPTVVPTEPPTTPTEPNTIILGDVDGDGEVTIIDATAIQRHLASIPTVSYNEKAADADGDGSVTIIDVTTIQRHLAQLPTNENIGKPIA